MIEKDISTELNVVEDEKSIEELISSGESVEIIYNYNGLDEPDTLEVMIGEIVVENVREVKLVATVHSESSMSIRVQTSGTEGVVVWKDYLVQSPNIYTVVKRSTRDS
jgi:hypothetical protein